jgi:outer membrane immunogenic protein
MVMNKSFVGALAIVAIVCGVANAADIPIHKAIPAATPYKFSWTGFYAGINGGGGWGTTNWTDLGGGLADHNVSGGLVGGTLGYNLQLGALVIGFEGDLDWANITGHTTCPNVAFTCNSKLSSFGTVDIRTGYAFDHFLVFGTFGLMGGNVSISTTSAALGTNGTSTTPVGWTWGVGGEYAFTDNWSAKIEYLRFDTTSYRYTVDSALQVNAKVTGNVVRAGLNYKFNLGGSGY